MMMIMKDDGDDTLAIDVQSSSQIITTDELTPNFLQA